MKATTYHMRERDGHAKVVGGSIGFSHERGLTLEQAAEELANREELMVLPSGDVTFLRNGKPVWCYLTVHPGQSEKGKRLLAAHRARLAAEREAEREAEERAQEELDEALAKADRAKGGREAVLKALRALGEGE